MALIGLVIATVVNAFWANSVLYWVITYIGVLLFVGLTAYDTQKIKHMLMEYGDEVNDNTLFWAVFRSILTLSTCSCTYCVSSDAMIIDVLPVSKTT